MKTGRIIVTFSEWTMSISINQSINQNFYCANIPGEGHAQWRTKQISVQKPIAKSQKPKARIRSKNTNRQSDVQAFTEGKPNQITRFLKVAVEGPDQTKRGTLFHRLGLQERKALAQALVLTLGTEIWIPLLDLSGRGGINGVSVAFK